VVFRVAHDPRTRLVRDRFVSEGLVSIQNPTSVIVALALGARPGEHILGSPADAGLQRYNAQVSRCVRIIPWGGFGGFFLCRLRKEQTPQLCDGSLALSLQFAVLCVR